MQDEGCSNVYPGEDRVRIVYCRLRLMAEMVTALVTASSGRAGIRDHHAPIKDDGAAAGRRTREVTLNDLVTTRDKQTKYLERPDGSILADNLRAFYIAIDAAADFTISPNNP
jgi:hypothetical protein